MAKKYLILLTFCAPLWALETQYQNPQDQALASEDSALDQQIKTTIMQIQSFHSLRDLKALTLSPQQTYVRLNNDGACIDVDSHSVNHTALSAKSAPVDYQLKSIRLCFSEKKLTRIESNFTQISNHRKEKLLNHLTHQDPSSAAVNDVVINGSFNGISDPALKVGDLENSLTKPHRVAFKRDYYLPHLKNTAYILQWTLDMHKRAAEKTNEKAVNLYLNYSPN